MHSDSDDDYIDTPKELDANVFHIWDPLQKPVTLQYTAERLHGACATQPLSLSTRKHLTRRKTLCRRDDSRG